MIPHEDPRLNGPMSIVVVFELPGSGDADVGLVGGLARLQLAAVRRGYRFVFTNAPEDLIALVALLGLGEVLSCRTGSGIESRGQPEQREESLGVEEPVQPDDPSIGDLEDVDRPGLEGSPRT